MEINFEAGGDIIKFRIINKKIDVLSKQSNYIWMRWNIASLGEKNLKKLKRAKGKIWFKEYQKDLEKFKKMNNDKEIADDLIKDFKKNGWKLISVT